MHNIYVEKNKNYIFLISFLHVGTNISNNFLPKISSIYFQNNADYFIIALSVDISLYFQTRTNDLKSP
jgi:hypothetical protein